MKNLNLVNRDELPDSLTNDRDESSDSLPNDREDSSNSLPNCPDSVFNSLPNASCIEAEKLDIYNKHGIELRVQKIKKGANNKESRVYMTTLKGGTWKLDTVPKKFGGGTYLLQYADTETGQILDQERKHFSKEVFTDEPTSNNDYAIKIITDNLQTQIDGILTVQKETNQSLSELIRALASKEQKQEQQTSNLQGLNNNPTNDNVLIEFMKQSQQETKDFYKELLNQERENRKMLEQEVKELRKSSPVQKPQANAVDDFAKVMSIVTPLVNMSGIDNNNLPAKIDDDAEFDKSLEKIAKRIELGVDIVNTLSGIDVEGLKNMVSIVPSMIKGFSGKNGNGHDKEKAKEVVNDYEMAMANIKAGDSDDDYDDEDDLSDYVEANHE